MQQQTATAEVLKVISRSTFDLQRCFKRLSRRPGYAKPKWSLSLRPQGGAFIRHKHGFPEQVIEIVRHFPVARPRDRLWASAGRGKIEHVPDVLAEPEYAYGGQKLGGYRPFSGVPLLREGIPVGVIVLIAKTVRPFTENQSGWWPPSPIRR